MRAGEGKWCPGRDSNSHALRRRPLKTVCLPVPPPGRSRERLSSTAPQHLQDHFFLIGFAGLAGGAVGAAAPLLAAGAGVAGVSLTGAPGAGTAAPPVIGAGTAPAGGTLGAVVPVVSWGF